MFDHIEHDMLAPLPEGCRLIHIMPRNRFDDGDGGICIPAVWRGDKGQFFGGYRTDTGSGIVFSSSAVSDPFTAARMACKLTAQACA